MAESIIEQLSNAIGSAFVISEHISDKYLEDVHGRAKGKALALLKPANVSEVAQCVKICFEQNISIVPQGGNTGYCAGSIPSPDGKSIILSLERLNAVRQIDPINLTMTVESGVILENIQKAAQTENLYFPLHLGASGSCQIGGNLSTNAGGVNVLKYGMVRQFCLGLEVVLPNGDILNDLNLLRKNNSGYDLKQLFIGAEGTLGIITAATFALYPNPINKATAMLAMPSAERCVELMTNLRKDSGDMLTSYEYFSEYSMQLVESLHQRKVFKQSENHKHYVLLEFSTSSKYIDIEDIMFTALDEYMNLGWIDDVVVASSEQQRIDLWQLRETVPEAEKKRGKSLKHDVSMPVSKIPDFIASFKHQLNALNTSEKSLPDISLYGHVGDGNLHISVLETKGCNESDLKQVSDLIYQVTEQFNGSFSAEHGVGVNKKYLFEKYKSKESQELMQSIKSVIDNKNIMNPFKIL